MWQGSSLPHLPSLLKWPPATTLAPWPTPGLEKPAPPSSSSSPFNSFRISWPALFMERVEGVSLESIVAGTYMKGQPAVDLLQRKLRKDQVGSIRLASDANTTTWYVYFGEPRPCPGH